MKKKNLEKKVVYIAADIPDSTSQKAKIAMAWAKNWAKQMCGIQMSALVVCAWAWQNINYFTHGLTSKFREQNGLNNAAIVAKYNLIAISNCGNQPG